MIDACENPGTAGGGVVEQMAGPPAEIVSQLAASGALHCSACKPVEGEGENAKGSVDGHK